MSNPKFKLGAVVTGIALAFVATASHASHFRGAAMIPTVNANGLVTVTTTSFWRNGAADGVSASVIGGTFQSSAAQVFDTSDSRFTKVTDVARFQISGAGTYAITGSSCCRVQGIRNFPGNSSVGWTMNSTLVWDGVSAKTPILFNFSSVQPEVVRGVAYSGNLSAIAGTGLTLSYDQILNGIPLQPPGFLVNSTTGALSISAADTAGYLDNSAGNPGADYAFSGNIKASDGSQVEFDWLFDAVNTASNNAPSVNDVIINALVGDTVSTTITGADDGLPIGALSWTNIGLLNPLGSCTNAPSFNSSTQLFTWNTTGCALGSYIYQVQVSDSLLTDVGNITINLSARQGGGGNQVPEPGTLSLLGLGAFGLAVVARRRKAT